MAEEHNKDWRNDPLPPVHHLDLLKLIGAGVLVGLVILLARAGYEKQTEIDAFDLNLTTEIIGIAVTVFIIKWFDDRRDKQLKLTELQQQLVEDAASTSNEIAKHAVHVIRRHGWHKGEKGLLSGKDLSNADLREAFLRGANLGGTDLRLSDMRGTDLLSVNLEEAIMGGADLRGAKFLSTKLSKAKMFNVKLSETVLEGVDLRGAYLIQSDLTKAVFAFSNLSGADLSLANMQGANFFEADLKDVVLDSTPTFDENTRLPDGRFWTPNIDLSEFTNPNHEAFWRSSDWRSPAFDKSKVTSEFWFLETPSEDPF